MLNAQDFVKQLIRVCLYPIQAARRRAVSDPAVLQRFKALSPRYKDLLHYIKQECPAATSLTQTECYAWDDWTQSISGSCTRCVPVNFLHIATIAQTMVYPTLGKRQLIQQRAQFVASVFGDAGAKHLLREDLIGHPLIVDRRWLSSPNRVHHAGHLAKYRQITGRDFTQFSTIAEWGAGYGDMARLVRRRNPECTYLIFDLPELLALQYVYLGSIIAESELHIVRNSADLADCKINLIPAALFEAYPHAFKAEAFLSTFALNESSKVLQEAMVGSRFLGSHGYLLAYKINRDNYLREYVTSLGLEELADNFLGPQDRYIFR